MMALAGLLGTVELKSRGSVCLWPLVPPEKERNFSQKLLCQWVGPMQVDKRLSAVSYRLRRHDGKAYEAHVRDLVRAPFGTDVSAGGMPLVTDYRRARPQNADLQPLLRLRLSGQTICL